MRTCTQCNGGGFVPIKGGTQSKRCPSCNRARTGAQPIDWGYIAFAAGVWLLITLATPLLRAWASGGWG